MSALFLIFAADEFFVAGNGGFVIKIIFGVGGALHKSGGGFGFAEFFSFACGRNFALSQMNAPFAVFQNIALAKSKNFRTGNFKILAEGEDNGKV